MRLVLRFLKDNGWYCRYKELINKTYGSSAAYYKYLEKKMLSGNKCILWGSFFFSTVYTPNIFYRYSENTDIFDWVFFAEVTLAWLDFYNLNWEKFEETKK